MNKINRSINNNNINENTNNFQLKQDELTKKTKYEIKTISRCSKLILIDMLTY